MPPEDDPATSALLPEGTPPFHVWRKSGEHEDLFKLPIGRVFEYVQARVPMVGETPKLEVVSGDLNSLADQMPVIRRVWELVLRAHNMVALPVQVKDAKAMVPPERYWDAERVSERRSSRLAGTVLQRKRE
jgi:hypothetical protein